VKNERFGQKVKGLVNSISAERGATAEVINDEIAEAITGKTAKTIGAATVESYKRGNVPDDHRIIEVLAELSVKAGSRNREWVYNFLQIAQYPAVEKLLDRLFPAAPAPRKTESRIYQNLPAPTYSQFVMRQQPYAEVVDGLSQRSAAVLIVSMGGMGKTSLAREVAARSMQPDSDVPKFQSVVWVSDKDRPGTTNLSSVLDEIARTLDYPGYTQFDFEEKRREVEQLLRRQRVLLVVDNFETITDGALVSWLIRLPEPSKAIITSREYSRAFRNNTFVLDLRGMTESEAYEYVQQNLRFLKLDSLVTSQEQLSPLLYVTGGNPKAISMALGCVKYERRPLQQVVDDLYAARGDIFDDLFARCWSLLDEAARRVLLSMTFFVDSASEEALSATADVTGFAFSRAIERLTDLALLDVKQEDLNSPPRYLLHPLVKAYSEARSQEQTDFQSLARSRWLQYFTNFVAQIKEQKTFEMLDILEQQDSNICACLDYAFGAQHWELFVTIYKQMHSFWSIRGVANAVNYYSELALEASEHLDDRLLQLRFLIRLSKLKSYKGDITGAKVYYNKAKAIHEQLQNRREIESFKEKLLICRILHLIAGEFYDEALEVIVDSGHYSRISKSYEWLHFKGVCLFELKRYDESKEVFSDLLHLEINRMVQVGDIAQAANYLAKIHMYSDIDLALNYIEQGMRVAESANHRPVIIQLLHTQAIIQVLRQNYIEARVTYARVLDLLERTGRFEKIPQIRQELDSLSV
jgi:tetratricopeptide (TPR) repeat protein